MPARFQAKRTKWYKKLCEGGCQFCGRRTPGLKNGGLQFAHIFPQKGDAQWNCLALCPLCHNVFDKIIKPVIQKAAAKAGITTLSLDWK